MAIEPVAPSVDPFEQVLTPKEQQASVTRGVDQIPAPQPIAQKPPVAANDDDDDEEETPTAPVAEGEDPFASFPKVKARDVSKTGAFLRAAGREILPTAGSLPAMAAGAELGATLGAPLGPVGSLVGGLGGGIAGGMLGSTALSSAQEWALKKLPDGWAEAIGMDDRQKRLDEEGAPTSSFLGGLVPFAVAMRPGSIPKGMLPENATATQRVLANPITARVFGGGIMGGMELASELGDEDGPTWTHVAIATGFGVVFNTPTKLGQRIMDTGGRPARRLLGREEPHEATAPAARAPDQAEPQVAPKPIEGNAPVTAAPETPTAPDNTQQVTSKDWNETLLGQKPAPTVAEVGDLKVVGPGITEEVYMGSHEQSPMAAQTAQEARRTEQSVIGPEPVADVAATAQQMHPEIFAHYEQLNRQRDEFRAWIAEHGEANSAAAIKHLADTEAELRELSSHMGAAYRRAAEATGSETLAPEAKAAAKELTGELRTPAPESNIKNVSLSEHPDLKATSAEIADIRDLLARKASPEEIEAHPLIQRAYELGEAYPPTDKVPGYGTPEYKANREFNFGGEKVVGYEAAINKLYDQARSLAPDGVKNDRKAFIVTGPGGAGKSTIVADPLARRFGAALVDADEAKPIMPEYRNGLGATAVHEESTDLMYGHDGVFGKLAGEGANMVIGKIGHNPESIRKLQTALEAKGYEVNLVNLRVDPEEAFRRRIGRFLRTGRVNSSGYTGDFKRMGGESANAYDIHKAEGKFNETLDLDVNTRPVQVVDGTDTQLARELGFSEGRTGDGQDAGHLAADTRPPAPAAPQVKIADTVASKLIRAGRPINEAEAAAQIVESYWQARADRFKGAKGTAEEMYLAESPDIVPGRDVQPPPSAQPRVFARTEAAPIDSPIKNGVADFDPAELIVDAKRFQFKGGGDEHGVTDRLKGVKKWDPIKAGMVLVWEDATGKRYIVDGHQRAGLAKRIASEDPTQKPRLNGYLIKEGDGVTDVEARAVAAAKNIAEGTGTTVDAAKVFRDHPELIKDLPPQSELVRQGRALSNLSDEAFGMVVNDVVPPNYAAIVGRLVPEDAERQSALLRLLSKTDPANATQAESIVRQGIEAGFAKQNKESQGGLFGDQDVAESLYSERAKVLDRALKDIKRDKTVFSVLTKEAESIEGAGNKLAGDVNQKRAQADAQALQILQTLANKTGPISDALNTAAKKAKTDGKYPDAVREFVKAIREQAESGDLARVADGGSRGEERAIPENEAGAKSADEFVKELFQKIKRERNLHAEREAEGQMSLLGTERLSDAERAQRAADDKLRPTVGQKPMDEGLFGDSHNQKTLFHTAYHGSPYDFNMFDTGAIGKGEGQQVYGHGLYFAGLEKEAEFYRRGRFQTMPAEYSARPDAQRRAIMAQVTTERPPLEAAKFAQYADTSLRAEPIEKIADEIAKIRPVLKGNLYRVDIKPEAHEFVQWDNSVAGQAPEIRAKIDAAAEKMSGIKNYSGNEDLGGRSIDSFLYDMAHKKNAGSPEAVSKALAEAGVPGIRYLDGHSQRANQYAGDLERLDARIAELKKDGDAPQLIRDAEDRRARLVELLKTEPSYNYVVFDPKHIQILDKNGNKVSREEFEMAQGHRGKIRIRDDGRNTITLMKSANPSTFIHETGHDWLERMATDSRDAAAPADLKADAQAVFKWLGVSGPDEIKTRHHEKFARGFENYIMEGRAPNAGLAKVFAQFKDWLVKIYETASRLNAPINDEIRGVFDRLIGTEARHTVIAEETPSRQTIHDIHADEAKYLAPHEADAAADRIAAESGRVVEELPPEIRNEIQAKVEQIEAAEAARTDAAGETAGGGAERKPVGAGGAEPGSERPGSSGSEGAGSVSERGTQSEAQGAGAFSATERASRRQDAGDGLSPEPARQFGPSESPFIDRAGNIRVENLSTSQDVARAIHEAADANEGFIGDRRGVITDGQVLELADALGMDASKLNERRLGQAFNAEQIVAARKLLIESATELSAVMKKAATGTDEDVMAYAIAKDRHQMIQAQVAGITAEAGRALRAFRSLAGEEGAMATDQFIKQATGKTLFQLRQEAQLGMTLETPEQVSKFMHDASRHSFGRMIQETWINAILSGPATHSTNIIGNTILSLQHFGPETAIAAAVGRARRAMGREGTTVRLGEIAAALQGAKHGAAGALEATAQSVKLGTSALLPGETVRTLDVQPHNELAPRWEYDEATTFHQVMENAFGAVQGIKDAIVSSAKLLGAGGVEGAPLIGPQYSHTGAIPDIAIKGVNVLPIGTIIRGPGRALAAADTFFRAANYSAAKNAMAYRMASDEGLTGATFDKRVAELRDNPTPEMMEESRNVATEQTLQTKGGKFVQAMNMLANATVNLPIVGEIPPLKFINPFVNIASQIIKQTIVKRTPLGILSPELRADLMGQNGNVAQDMAQARMLMGTGVAVTMGMLAAGGYATGSGPKKPDENAMWRLAGNQAHSIRIGDFWYDTSKLGPLGMLMGIAADMYEVGTKAQAGEYTEAAAKFHHAITQNILDQSFMKGPADLIQAVEDPERYGGRYVRNFLSSFVPYSNALAQATKRVDPYTRETRTLLDAIKAKLPWESQTLMPKRDVWGEPMANRDAIGGAGVTAIYAKQMSTDPVNLSLAKMGIGITAVPKKIRNVELTPEQYDDFSRIAGRMTKMRLDTIVKSPDFQTWPDQSKRDVITATVKLCREAARGVMFGKYPQIIQDGTDLKRKKHQPTKDE